jgi:hypothetical protein
MTKPILSIILSVEDTRQKEIENPGLLKYSEIHRDHMFSISL